MKFLLALLLIAGPAKASDISPAKRTTIQIGGGGGNDPTKLPLAGGTMAGNIIMSNGTQVSLSSGPGSSQQGGIRYSTNTSGGLILEASDGDLGGTVFNFVSRNGSVVAIFLSTSPVLDTGSGSIVYNKLDQSLEIVSGPNGGSLILDKSGAILRKEGGLASFEVYSTSAVIKAQNINFEAGAGTLKSNASVNDFTLGTMKLPGTTGKALCVNALNTLSVCTSGVTASGICTCP